MNDTNLEVRDWYADRYQSIFVSRNRWLLTAVIALGLAAFQALSLVCLIPLKTVVPFLIREDSSGAVSMPSPVKGDGSITYDESLQKYFLAKYVIARETYDTADLANNYHAVALMSDPDISRDFNQAIASSNPRSPIAVYGQRAKRSIRIKSISFLNDHMAQVRITAIEQKGSASAVESQWASLVGFRFGKAPGLDSERFINPLGFFVTHYRIDQEVVP
jgi:type IV secretion system protein VirB8